jgi:hypothetical protein
MVVSERDMEKLSLSELADLLGYYNLYDTTANTSKPRPSGKDLKKHLQRRLCRVGEVDAKLAKEPPMLLDLDLNNCMELHNGNILQGIYHELLPFFHDGNRALKRKPMEIAREVTLHLMENNYYNHNALRTGFLLRLEEYKIKPHANMAVWGQGIDWVLYTHVVRIQQHG